MYPSRGYNHGKSNLQDQYSSSSRKCCHAQDCWDGLFRYFAPTCMNPFFCNFFTLFVPKAAKVGTLRNNDGDGNGNGREAIDLVSKTTTLHVHHAFLYISLPPLHDYDVKWPNFKFFKDGNGKAINSTISVWTQAWLPLFLSDINSLLLSNWATLEYREMVWKDAESIFQGCFHGRCSCGIVRSLIA